MTAEEARQYEADPDHIIYIRMRSWDEQAKVNHSKQYYHYNKQPIYSLLLDSTYMYNPYQFVICLIFVIILCLDTREGGAPTGGILRTH